MTVSVKFLLRGYCSNNIQFRPFAVHLPQKEVGTTHNDKLL